MRWDRGYAPFWIYGCTDRRVQHRTIKRMQETLGSSTDGDDFREQLPSICRRWREWISYRMAEACADSDSGTTPAPV
jgi:hypothetical protein